METKPRRRWFRFSLRGLLIAVTLLSIAGGYVLREWRITLRRYYALQAAITEPYAKEFPLDFTIAPVNRISWMRRKLGDLPLEKIVVLLPLSQKTVDGLRTAFPEAEVTVNIIADYRPKEPAPRESN